MTDKTAMLRRWNPTPGADADGADEEAAGNGILAPADLYKMSNRDQVALYRAAALNGLAERIFDRNPNLDGAPWYDALERIVDVEFEYVVDGERISLYGPRDAELAEPDAQTDRDDAEAEQDAGIGRASTDAEAENGQAEEITARLTVERGDTVRTIELPTDFLVIDEYEADPRKAGVLVTTDCQEGLDELQELLCNALFEPGEDDDDDSFETQQFDFREWAHEAVCKLMLDAQTAEVEIIRYAVRTHVMRKLPKDGITQIRRRGDDVEVELLPEEHAESTDGG